MAILPSPLKQRTFLVTGASSGIGYATAFALGIRGVSLVLIARREERLVALKQKILEFNSLAQIDFIVGDLNHDTTFDELQKKNIYTQIDGLINNAGLALGRDPVEKANWDDYDQMLQTNIRSVFKLTHLVLPEMLKKEFGDILNICSIAGHHTYPGGAVYCASKHALWAYTKVLREETCGRGVRVMQISPGMVESEFSLVRFKGQTQEAQNVYQNMRPLTPEDIARHILFMLEEPRHVTIDEITTMPTDQGSPTTIRRHP